jgi:hypothetical protein
MTGGQKSPDAGYRIRVMPIRTPLLLRYLSMPLDGTAEQLNKIMHFLVLRQCLAA